MLANDNAVLRVKDVFDSIVAEMSKTVDFINSNTFVQQFFASPQGAKFGRKDAIFISDMSRILHAYTLSRNYLDSIYVYSTKSRFVSIPNLLHIDDFYDKEVINTYLMQKEYTTSLIARTAILPKTTMTENDLLTYIQPINSLTEDFGLIIINLDITKLGEIVDSKSTSASSHLMITDPNNNILYSSIPSEFSKNLTEIGTTDILDAIAQGTGAKLTVNNIPHIISIEKSENFDIKLISLLPLEHYMESKSFTYIILTAAIFLSLLLAGIISLFISVRLFKPIENVFSAIENPEKWLINPPQEKGFDELKYISQNIIRSFQTHKEMNEKLAHRLSLLKNAQNLALYSQITPHFLFNTLQMINMMAIERLKGDNKISNTINLLADMLRISLREGENMIPLSIELKHAQLYEQIQKERCGNLFEINWNVANGLTDYMVPKVILQPLIENAIDHGIKYKESRGTIDVIINTNGDDLVIMVNDDGIGLNEDEIEKLNHKLASEYSNAVDHIGLQNVNQRVKITYGEAYGVTVSKNGNIGLSVCIVIPKLTTTTKGLHT